MYEYLNFRNDHFNYFLQYFDDVGVIFLRFFKPNKLYIFGSCMVFNGFNQHWKFLCVFYVCRISEKEVNSESNQVWQWIVQCLTVGIVQSVNSEGYEKILHSVQPVLSKSPITSTNLLLTQLPTKWTFSRPPRFEENFEHLIHNFIRRS